MVKLVKQKGSQGISVVDTLDTFTKTNLNNMGNTLDTLDKKGLTHDTKDLYLKRINYKLVMKQDYDIHPI